MNNLGICYEDGLGVQADKDAALGCYQRAADHGHLGAMLNLAYLHFSRYEFSSPIPPEKSLCMWPCSRSLH